MRILAIDVGTGTQDILLFDSALVLENNPKLVMPSATTRIARLIEGVTLHRRPLLLTGVTMGGGPCAWAAEAHLQAGLAVYATPDAARTFDDHLENVARMGVQVVSEDEAAQLHDAVRIEMKDVDLHVFEQALTAFGVEPRYDGVAVAVFDHGAAPADVSDRTFRFDHLRRVLTQQSDLQAFGDLADEVPDYMTRMRSVAAALKPSLGDTPLLLLDTAPAGALGALGDPQVRDAPEQLLVNLGNMHATAFRISEGRILGLFEHHTGLVDQAKLNGLLGKLVSGTLQNDEVFDDHGHGAWVKEPRDAKPLLAVTGPQRALLRGSPLQPHFAAPHGDMMLSGCFGLVRAFARKMPAWREEIEATLDR